MNKSQTQEITLFSKTTSTDDKPIKIFQNENN